MDRRPPSAEEIEYKLARALQSLEKTQNELTALRGAFDHLVALLQGKSILNEGNLRLLERAANYARLSDPPRVRLKVLSDKYSTPLPEIDCATLAPLCQVRCCTLNVELSVQDLDEGGIRWEHEQPYLLKHDVDGYCAHMDRGTAGCTIYDKRPEACRSYDCREDRRVWLDFEARIPAPMPGTVVPLRR